MPPGHVSVIHLKAKDRSAQREEFAVKVKFYDQQNEANPMNGTTISTRSELLEILDSLTDREPFFVELVAQNTYTLLIGIGGTIGCVQHSGPDRNPPYMMALGPTEHQNREVELTSFRVG